MIKTTEIKSQKAKKDNRKPNYMKQTKSIANKRDIKTKMIVLN